MVLESSQIATTLRYLYSKKNTCASYYNYTNSTVFGKEPKEL